MNKIITRAIEILENYGWIQGCKARDKNGFPTGFRCQTAHYFCVTGAIMKADYEINGLPSFEATSVILNFSDFLGVHVTDWNDKFGRTKEEVLAKLREYNVQAAA